MSRHLLNQQIVLMHVRDALTCEQIAESLGLEKEAVGIVLASQSSRDVPVNKGLSIEEKLKVYEDIAIDSIGSLASTAENEGVRLSASQFIVEIRGGMKKKAQIGPDINVVNLNMIIQQGLSAYKEAIEV